jgi:ATP-dependent DNA helicase RecQ
LENTTSPLPEKRSAIEFDKQLFEILRQQRKKLADAAHVPPFVIFSDKTLVEMANYYPMTEQGMKSVNGVGEVKFSRYGDIFLELIRDYCQQRNLVEKPRQYNNQKTLPTRAPLSARTIRIGESFNSGNSIIEIATEWQVAPDRLLQLLTDFALDGNNLRQNEEFLALSQLLPDQQQAVLQAFNKFGAQRLKPVFEALYGKFSYYELKILRLHYLSSSKL